MNRWVGFNCVSSSHYDLVHFGGRSNSIDVHKSRSRYFLDVSLILRRLLLLFNKSDLVEHWLQDHVVQALLDEAVRLRQLIDVVRRIGNKVPVVFRGDRSLDSE